LNKERAGVLPVEGLDWPVEGLGGENLKPIIPSFFGEFVFMTGKMTAT